MDKPTPDNRGEFFDQFLDDYYTECDEHLVSIRRSLFTLEDEVDEGTLDRTVLDNLFRSFHTLKGISGMVGLSAAEQLAHHLESYLRELREGTVLLSDSGFQALVAGVSLLEGVINARRNDQPIPSIDEMVDRLQGISADSTQSNIETKGNGATATRWQIEFTPTAELAERGVNVNSVRARLQEIGHVVQAKPVVRGAGEIAFEFIVATKAEQTTLASLEADGLTCKPPPVEPAPRVRESQPVPMIA